MIAAGTWNINHVSQAGNQPTQKWLDRFSTVRIAETRKRLLDKAEVDRAWSRAIVDIVLPIITDPTLARVQPGTPMVPLGGGSSIVSRSDHVPDYSPGQFLADVLLLSQPSLREATLHGPLDISGRVFLVGPDFAGTRFEQNISAHGTKFGYFADMAQATFSNASFEESQFYGVSGWTLANFEKPVSFARTYFHDAASFNAAIFEGFANFSGARFDESAHFAGTVFKDVCCLDGAHFADYATFEHCQFAKAPSLKATVFKGPTSTRGVKASAREAIAAVSRPGPPIF
ncbi:pentapeptide repeat-containing protein [Mesorhizobium sp. KR9-304]|uniref:pentapeptide repeat-containing protein n=1 Tax=Mesorhizobium sp. KR9-304 TaxID=3156614 RepID=UPI0032B36BF9